MYFRVVLINNNNRLRNNYLWFIECLHAFKYVPRVEIEPMTSDLKVNSLATEESKKLKFNILTF